MAVMLAVLWVTLVLAIANLSFSSLRLSSPSFRIHPFILGFGEDVGAKELAHIAIAVHARHVTL